MSREHSEPIEVAEIVYEKPPAGAYDEVLFGSDAGNTLWVKFSDKDGVVEWIGKFGCGEAGGSRAAMRVERVSQPDRFLVSAGGFAYVVDASKRILLHHFFDINAREILYDAPHNRFIAADYLRVRIIESNQTVWTSPRIALDGIHSLKLEGSILSGLAITDYLGPDYTGSEEPFSIDLESRVVTCATDCSRWDPQLPPSSNGTSKPWWKLW